ncbi:hypothetical protein NRB_26310 [Novosphingobium sp. 11B]
MAKISDLPRLSPESIDGTELVPVVYDDETAAATLAELLAPALAQARNWAEGDGEPGGPGTKSAKTWAAFLGSFMRTISARSGWPHVFTDGAKNVLGGWKKDASFWTALSGNVDAAIAALRASVTFLTGKLPATISNRAGWIHVFTDGAKNKLFGADSTGDFIIGSSTNVSKFFRDGALSTVLQAALYPSRDFVIYGDSETEISIGWPEIAAAFAAIGEARNVFTEGFGGQASRSILARQGGLPALVTFANGASGFPEIPATTNAVSVTVVGNPLSYASIAQPKSMTGVIQVGSSGILGTLTRTANTNDYTFARAAAGVAVKVDKAVPFVPNNSDVLKRIQVCWIGTNDLIPAATPAETILSYIDLYVARQATLNKRTIVMMPLWDMDSGTSAASRAIYDNLLALVKAKYPHCYIDTVAVLQRAVANPDQNDRDDINAGLVPRSIMANDRLHFPTGGAAYIALAAEILNVTKRNGW